MPKSDKIVVCGLLTREIRPIYNWQEWLGRWQAAGTLEEMLGLLHTGFNVSLKSVEYGGAVYSNIDRLIFYFTIADGWINHHLLEAPEDQGKEYEVGQDKIGNVIRKKPSELRQQVARKAFGMLSKNFFKMSLSPEPRGFKKQFRDDWEKVVASEQLFPIIQKFFRAETPWPGSSKDIDIRNLSRSRHENHAELPAVNFLLNLARFVWGWEAPDIYSWSSTKDKEERESIALRSRLDAAKPWMIEILSILHELNILREWILELNKACLVKLKEIALRKELYHPTLKDRAVATLDEACYANSNAAWFLKEYELKKREDARLRAIFVAEQKKVEAERKIKRLTT